MGDLHLLYKRPTHFGAVSYTHLQIGQLALHLGAFLFLHGLDGRIVNLHPLAKGGIANLAGAPVRFIDDRFEFCDLV